MVRHSDWLTESWNLFAAQAGQWIIIGLILFVVGGAASMLLALVSFGAAGFMGAGMSEQMPISISIPVTIVLLIVGSGIFLLLPPLMAGAYIAAINQLRTGKVELSDLMAGFKFFWQMNFLYAVIGLFVMIGCFFCLLPGLYIAALSFFCVPLIVDKRMGYWDAFLKSRELIQKEFWNFLLYIILAAVINSLGGSFPLLILVTMPVYILMHVVAMRDTLGLEGVPPRQYPVYPGAFTPPPPQPPPPPGTMQQGAFCAHCGAPVTPADRFCVRCGAQRF